MLDLHILNNKILLLSEQLKNICSHFTGYVFVQLIIFSCAQKLFSLVQSHSSIFFIVLLGCPIKEINAKTNVQKFSPMFSFRGLTDWSLVVKYLIHFELWLCTVWPRGTITVFYIWMSSFPSNFPHCVFLAPFVKMSWLQMYRAISGLSIMSYCTIWGLLWFHANFRIFFLFYYVFGIPIGMVLKVCKFTLVSIDMLLLCFF